MSSNQEQIDDFMYRTFGYPPLRKAPTESGLDPEQHAALMRRFPPPATPAPPPATHEPETPEEQREAIEEWMETHRESPYSRRGSAYQAARPRQTRTGLRPHGADEEDTPMRSIRVTGPTRFGTYGQPAITYRNYEPLLDGGPQALRDNEAIKEAKRKLAAEHVKQGTLTDGTELLNLGGLAKHQADLIAKEYIKWRKSGGGPFPDLSKYENPVPRRKDGTLWDYREAFKRMADLDDRAKQYDGKHGLNLSSNIFDPHYAWYHIHLGIDPSEHGTGAGSLKELERSGLSPHQYMEGVKDLMNLGLHHQRLSRLHSEGADDE